jgi:hypothetical protein
MGEHPMNEVRAIDRLLRGLLVVMLLACAAGAVPALIFIDSDLEASGEWLDGLGVAIGLAILAVLAVPAGLTGWALRASFEGWSSAPAWALAAAGTGVLVGIGFGFAYRPLLAVVVVPVLLGVVAYDVRRVR